MISNIATVAVYVEDQAAAERFWTECVGFEVRRNDQMGPSVRWQRVRAPRVVAVNVRGAVPPATPSPARL